jgi:hypothetical protein
MLGSMAQGWVLEKTVPDGGFATRTVFFRFQEAPFQLRSRR